MHRSLGISGLFWNIGRMDRSRLVAEAAAERDLDIIVLAESGGDLKDLLKSVSERTGIAYSCPTWFTPRFQILTRFADLDMNEIYGTVGGRLSVRRLHWNGDEILFIAAHLADKHNTPDADQHTEAQVLGGQIRIEEEKAGHRRTILVGDLNMNPFERGVVQAAGLHAMMAKADISTGNRIVQWQEYPFFYNPMWGLFGDRTPGPPGTYFFPPQSSATLLRLEHPRSFSNPTPVVGTVY